MTARPHRQNCSSCTFLNYGARLPSSPAQVKNLTGLAEWYASNERLRGLVNLVIVGEPSGGGGWLDSQGRQAVRGLARQLNRVSYPGRSPVLPLPGLKHCSCCWCPIP